MSNQIVLAILGPIIILLVGILGFMVQLRVGGKGRNINVVMQLIKDFYQDSEFTVNRLTMWDHLRNLEPEEFNYQRLIEVITNDRTSELKQEEVVALSRTAAFYNSIRVLIDTKEVDKEMLRSYFSYNYTRFYNTPRALLEKYSDKSDAPFFKEVKELYDPNVSSYFDFKI